MVVAHVWESQKLEHQIYSGKFFGGIIWSSHDGKMWHQLVGLGKTLGKLDLFSLQLPIIPSHNQVTWYKMLWLWVTDIVNKDGWKYNFMFQRKERLQGVHFCSKLWPSPWNISVTLVYVKDGSHIGVFIIKSQQRQLYSKNVAKNGIWGYILSGRSFPSWRPRNYVWSIGVGEMIFLGIFGFGIPSKKLTYPTQTGSSENHHLQISPFLGDMYPFPGGYNTIGHLGFCVKAGRPGRRSQGWGFHALGIPCRGRVYKDRSRFGRVTKRWYKDLFVDLCKVPRDEILPFWDSF